MKTENQPSPFARFSGMLELGETLIDCYVLDTEERVISFRSAAAAITETESGDLADYIGVKPLKPYINKRLILAENIEFYIPGTQYLGNGLTSGNFLKICKGYVGALSDGKLKTRNAEKDSCQV